MSVKMQGRVAGLIYLGVVLTGIFSLAYAPGKWFVDNDALATAAAISANAALFNASNVSALVMCAFFLALPFALARFLSPYGRNAARLMILLVALSIPFSVAAIAQHIDLARLVADGAASAEAVDLRLAAYGKWMDVASIFWGLWLAPLGWLILKSGAIPRILGVILILGCIEYLSEYLGPMISDGYEGSLLQQMLSWTSSVGEIGTCLWLLIMGAREKIAP